MAKQVDYHHTYLQVIDTMKRERIRAEYAYFLVSKDLNLSFAGLKARIKKYCKLNGKIRPENISEMNALISQLSKCRMALDHEKQAAEKVAAHLRDQRRFVTARAKFIKNQTR